MRSFGSPEDKLSSLAFSPNGRLLAGASRDTVRLWEPTTGEEVRSLPGGATSVAFSQEGMLVGAGSPISTDEPLRLWDVETGQLVRTLISHNPRRVAFSPNGWRLVSVGEAAGDHTVQLWDARSGELLWARTQQGFIQSVVFSPDGVHLASSDDDGKVRLRDVQTGEEQQAFTGSGSTCWALAFQPDGDVLAGAGGDGVVRLWDLRAGAPGSGEVHALTTEGGWICLAGIQPRRWCSGQRGG